MFSIHKFCEMNSTIQCLKCVDEVLRLECGSYTDIAKSDSKGQENESHKIMASTDTTETPSSDAGDAQGLRYNGSPALFARMPAEIDAVYYSMSHKKRGLAVIFNHENFDIQSLKSRAGTKVDRNNLSESLSKLGFEVKVYDDLTYKSVKEIVEEAARYDHNECDCFVMAVLSHGEMGILYAKDTAYKPEFLWTHFTADRCPSLAGKPKLFFIQACQGDKLDGGITLRTETDGAPLSYRIPTQADFLIAYSTVPGYYSWRNTTYGSWFMQALCWELQSRGTKLDILTLLTFVCQRVAIDFESNTPNNDVMHRQKQIPCITTMLTRLLRFEEKK
ncbi:caspase-1-like isoform X3 [Schistocerca gregaria]|uniref:caspase-1-like isoform X3 n=2 Tax=Schistocerca gregaria TaxID=7010 RepID=UPI00211E419E|nr:caspase-1-like isoform X3 [Schistocerca gregaria]